MQILDSIPALLNWKPGVLGFSISTLANTREDLLHLQLEISCSKPRFRCLPTDSFRSRLVTLLTHTDLFSVWLSSVFIFSDFWTASFIPLSCYQTGFLPSIFVWFLFPLNVVTSSGSSPSLSLSLLHCWGIPFIATSSWFQVESSGLSLSSLSSTLIELNQSTPNQAQCRFY